MRFNSLLLTVGMSTVLLAGCGSSGGGGGDDKEANKPSPTLRISSQSVREGDQNSILTIPVTRSASSVSSSVSYRVLTDSASSGTDYISTDGTIEFASNVTQSVIEVEIVGDTTYENNEIFRVELHNPSNATINRGTAEITIQNDDDMPSISFSSKRQTTSEESPGASVELTLSNLSETEVTVPLVIEGTATIDVDYTLSETNTITFPALSDRAEIDISILSDAIPEGGESITLGLGDPDNATRGSITSHQVIISGQIALNDTGYVDFSDDTNFDLFSEPLSHPFQDASHGRDLTVAENQSDGLHSMSFTKLDEDGNAVSPNASDFNCILDNTTGLVFEVKQAYNEITVDGLDVTVLFPGRYRSSSFRYYWYNNEDPYNTGGSKGHEGGRMDKRSGRGNDASNGALTPDAKLCAYPQRNDRPHNLRCSSDYYKKEVNWRGLCGFQDWRLPTISELRSIASYDQSLDPQDGHLDKKYFPYGLPDQYVLQPGVENVEYFSNNPDADNEASAWCFNAITGTARLCHKGSANYLRLVRSGEK